MQDKSIFTNLMVSIGAFYGKAISPSRIDCYWQMFKKFEVKHLKQPFNPHILDSDDGQYFEKLSDLLRFIAWDPDTKAEQAWRVVECLFRSQACYESFVLSNPITSLVLEEMGESVKDCAAVLKEINFYAFEFKKLHRNLQDHFQKKFERSE